MPKNYLWHVNITHFEMFAFFLKIPMISNKYHMKENPTMSLCMVKPLPMSFIGIKSSFNYASCGRSSLHSTMPHVSHYFSKIHNLGLYLPLEITLWKVSKELVHDLDLNMIKIHSYWCFCDTTSPCISF